MRNRRRPKGMIFPNNTVSLHLTNPWVIAWWSAAFPGFGHIMMGSYPIGFLLVVWEFMINVYGRLNIAIMYSFTGRFDLATAILDKRWILLYPLIYVFSIWDSYRLSVEQNKYARLADAEGSPIIPFAVGTNGFNYIDKRTPWLAALWSALIPGAGHLYNHRVFKGFFVIICWVVSVYMSHFLEAVHFTSIGSFYQAKIVTDPQWLLFLPSFYGGVIYDSYVDAVEGNKLFEREQSRFLKENYQDAAFEMPIK